MALENRCYCGLFHSLNETKTADHISPDKRVSKEYQDIEILVSEEWNERLERQHHEQK
jgi:5'-deoxynucleotidase YfbR-like HD superfamily hydrolase